MTSQIRPVSGFSRVDLRGLGHLVIEQGETEALRIEAAADIVDEIVTEVKGDTLDISFRRRWYDWFLNAPRADITYYLTVKSLHEIKLSGYGSFRCPSLKTDSMVVAIRGSGRGELGLEAQELVSKIAGSGDLAVSGKVNRQEVRISGSGKYIAKGLESVATIIDINGAGDAVVNVQERLKVAIKGTGDISYVGAPVLEQSIWGTGRINRIG
jgi:hypothetical protein